MKTAILVFVLIVIAVAIFYFGVIVGGYAAVKRIADATERALEKSDLTLDQKYDLLNSIKDESQK